MLETLRNCVEFGNHWHLLRETKTVAADNQHSFGEVNRPRYK